MVHQPASAATQAQSFMYLLACLVPSWDSRLHPRRGVFLFFSPCVLINRALLDALLQAASSSLSSSLTKPQIFLSRFPHRRPLETTTCSAYCRITEDHTATRSTVSLLYLFPSHGLSIENVHSIVPQFLSKLTSFHVEHVSLKWKVQALPQKRAVKHVTVLA